MKHLLLRAALAKSNMSRGPMSEEQKQKIAASVSRAMTEEVRNRISRTLQGRVAPQEERDKISAALQGRTLTLEWKRKMSLAMTGREHTYETKQRIAAQLVGNKFAEGCVVTQATRQLLSEERKRRWQDPEYCKRVITSLHTRPNLVEQELLTVLSATFPNMWRYVGDGSVVIGGKIPDFIDELHKRLIEVFGIYWHDPVLFPKRLSGAQLMEHYRVHGYKCLILQEFEVFDTATLLTTLKAFQEV